MNTIFSTCMALTSSQLPALINKYLNKQQHQVDGQDQRIEVWIFGDRTHRQNTEKTLLKSGIKASVHSAYKPLLHFFSETADLHQISRIEVHYPLHPSAVEARFLLEAYPLAALSATTAIAFFPYPQSIDTYRIILHHKNGGISQHNVFAPNYLHQDLLGQTHLSSTGWLRITDSDGRTQVDQRLETDYEKAFFTTMAHIVKYPWGGEPPYFAELNIRISLPWQDQNKEHNLAGAHHHISLSEALHEELYFSLQAWFKATSGQAPDARTVQMGQIVPEIVFSSGNTIDIRVETRPYDKKPIAQTEQSLISASSPLSIAQITKELAAIPGKAFGAKTATGNSVNAIYHHGSDAPVMISGGQHANETSGVVGALRAAQTLAEQANSHFTVAPLENPDGYRIHQRLIIDNPCHMHHAARFTALGDDLAYRQAEDGLYEQRIQQHARALSQASLHINLHGYPAHEWTRPLSGYIPEGYYMWTIPKGFLLILRHYPNRQWQRYARQFLSALTKELAKESHILNFNQQQIALYKMHSPDSDFEMFNGFPCLLSVSDSDRDIPIQLITEYPDETIYGQDFQHAHDIQTATVLMAYRIHQMFAKSCS